MIMIYRRDCIIILEKRKKYKKEIAFLYYGPIFVKKMTLEKRKMFPLKCFIFNSLLYLTLSYRKFYNKFFIRLH